ASIAPVRDDEGRMTLERSYRFAYSDTGHNRRRGRITLMGRRVVALELEGDPLRDGSLMEHDSVN
ncbi:MAG: DUF3301 domain-containing protein, partial [Casimicrobiaceae bacterium]